MSNKSNWFSWQDLLEWWGVKDFEFLDYLKEGLQPYSRSGNPIHCPDSHHATLHKGWVLSRLNKKVINLKELDELKKIIEEGKTKSIKVGNPRYHSFVHVVDSYRNLQIYFDDIGVPKTLKKETKSIWVDIQIPTLGGPSVNRGTYLYSEQIEKLKIVHEKKIDLQNELEAIKNDDPNCHSWKYFIRPSTDKKVEELIANLEKAIFRSRDVEEFEKEHGLRVPDDKITEEPISNKNVFRKEGPSWAIIYEGKSLRGLKAMGFEIIHYLILNERKTFHTDELRIEFDKILPNEEKSLREIDLDHSDDNREAVKGGIDSRDKIYGKSVKEFKAHRAYLQDELRKAEIDNDPARKAKFEKEFEEFDKHCTEYFGLKGKSRKDRDNTIKTKDRICKRIERSLDILKKHDDNTWHHFYNALRPINSYFQSYQPDRDIDWLT